MNNGPVPPLAEVWDRSQNATTHNLGTLLSQIAKEHANRIALTTYDNNGDFDKSKHGAPRTWTYKQLYEESLLLAQCMLNKGITSGDRIASILYNQYEWALFFWAAALVGCQFVGVDYRAATHAEYVRDLLGRVKCDAIAVANQKLATVIDEALDQDQYPMKVRCVIEESCFAGWTSLSDLTKNTSSSHKGQVVSQSQPEDTAVVFFTSGTTGSSKACPHNAITLCSAANGLRQAHSIDQTRTICQHLPGFHIFSVAYTLTAWLNGGSVVFPNPTFDADKSIHAITQHQNVILPCVPLMVQAIAGSASRPEKFDTLELVTLGGSSISPEILKLPASFGSKRIAAGFGMSETLVVASFNQKAEVVLADTKEDVCLGSAISGSCIRICAPDTRTAIRRGEIGEIHLGGLPVFNGYLDLKHESCYREGDVPFMISGDQGYMDEEGRLYVLGRYKDLIIRGGENISPARIERILSQGTGITAQVVGIPQSGTEEAIVAVIRRDPGAEYDGDDLRNTVSSILGPELAPSMILDLEKDLGRDKFPMTASGKAQKPILRQWVMEHVRIQQPDQVGDESAPLETQLTGIWASLTGRSATSIEPDTSVHKFADSMILIQFCSAVLARYKTSVAVKDLVEFKTIRSQAELINERMQVVSSSGSREEIPPPAPKPWWERASNQRKMPGLEDAVLKRVEGMGFGREDVEDVFPKVDIIGRLSRGARPGAWNHRRVMIARGYDADRLASSIATWLEKHPLLRSVTVSSGTDDSFVIMKGHSSWLSNQIFHGESIEGTEMLLNYRIGDPDWDCVSIPGPFLKATILPIQNTQDTGLIFHLHHLVFDGIILRQWFRELDHIIAGRESPYVFESFGRYSDALDHWIQTGASNSAVQYHVDRLRGIGAAANCLWPPQRAPLWMKGDDSGWKYPDGRPGEPEARKPLDGAHSRGGLGLLYSAKLPHMMQLKETFEIPPPIVTKGACVLLNLHLTGGDEAVFNTYESGRAWPVSNGNSEAESGRDVNPLSIDGGTFTLAVSRTRVAEEETSIQLLNRLLKEQHEIDQNSQAPIDHVIDQLERPQEGASQASTADAQVVRDCIKRQFFDWLPDVRLNQSDSFMELVENIMRCDLGVLWFPSFNVSEQTLKLGTTWDDAQLSTSEVSEVMKKFLSAIAWLTEPENWERPAKECKFDIEGFEIADVGEKIYRR